MCLLLSFVIVGRRLQVVWCVNAVDSRFVVCCLLLNGRCCCCLLLFVVVIVRCGCLSLFEIAIECC